MKHTPTLAARARAAAHRARHAVHAFRRGGRGCWCACCNSRPMHCGVPPCYE